jgi:hypothetical protein
MLETRFSRNGIPLATPVRDMILEGYREAVAHARSALTGRPSSPPRGEEILCLFHVYSEPDWARLRSSGRPFCHFRPLAREILLRSGFSGDGGGQREGRPCRIACGEGYACPKDSGCPNLAEVVRLNSIIDQWGTAWLICIYLLPEGGAI